MTHKPCHLAALMMAVFATFGTTRANAQERPAQPEATPPVQMLTGCLRSSAADTAVAGPSGRLFTLEAVEQPRPGTDVAGKPPAQATKVTYSLSAAESLALAKHADHEVQLTGRLQAPTTAATASPGDPKAKPAAPGGGHRTFEVTALKMVSTNCP